MDRVAAMFGRLSLCVLLLLSLWHGAHGARMLSARVQGELPPCRDVFGGIQNWDCFDPPSTPLPPCDFKHQNPGIDCSTDSQIPRPPKAKSAVTDISAVGGASVNGIQSAKPAQSGAHHVIQGELPPCRDVFGGIQNWDCYDPPSTPLPPCDFKHQNPGIDCSTDSQIPRPPKAKSAVTDISAVGRASVHGVQSAKPAQSGAHHVIQGELPPCRDVFGGIQNWDCYDPPSTPLPPCDFKHQNPSIDCSTDSQIPRPPKAKSAVTDISGVGRASVHGVQSAKAAQSGAHHVIQGELPPCRDVFGGIQNWDCYDPPSTPLPPCDFKHQNPGIDCSTDSQIPRPPKAKSAVTDISGVGRASVHGIQSAKAAQSGAHHVIQGELPPCRDVFGGIQNWDCFDPPSTPLPPCDFKHQNPGIDCSTDSQIPRPGPK